MYLAKMLADSVSPDGVRLTTLEVEYPHAIHKDIMTHRMFSRNFQSFRAYPPEKVVANIAVDPFVPESFDYRVTGMGQGKAVGSLEAMKANAIWTNHVENSLQTAESMMKLGLAKAQINFVLQDLTWIRGIITATEWDNFWDLRLATHPETGKPMARPEVYKIASMMKRTYDDSQPQKLDYDEWHTPLADGIPEDVDDLERAWEILKAVSTGRCARVSYLTHDGVRDPMKDVGLHDGLAGDKHMSPFEHVARPIPITGPKYVDEINSTTRKSTGNTVLGPDWRANFYGWHQYRSDMEA
jgi:hypothetical protein